jgi:hypothetical protein
MLQWKTAGATVTAEEIEVELIEEWIARADHHHHQYVGLRVIGKPRLGDEVLKSQDHRGRSIDIGIRVTIVDAQFRVRQSQIPGKRFAKEIEVGNCSTPGFQENPAEVTITSTIQINDNEAEAHQEIAQNVKDLEELLVGVPLAERTSQLRPGLLVVSDPHIDQTRQPTKRQQYGQQIRAGIVEARTSRKDVVIRLYLAVTGLHRVHGHRPQGAVRTVENEVEVLRQTLIKERQVATDHHIHILRKRAGAEVVLRIAEDGHRKSIVTHRRLDLETLYRREVEVHAPHPLSVKKVLDRLVTNIDRVHQRLLKVQREHPKHQAQTALRSICPQGVILDNLAIIIQTSRCRLPFH